MQLDTPKINLREMDFIVCESCGFDQFKEVTYLKKVPKLLTGSPEDNMVPFPTYMCNDCGHVNIDFKLFD